MKITLNRASVYEYKGIVLVAGDNEVNAEQSAMLLPKNGIGIRPDVEAGVLTLHEDKPAPKTRKAKISDEEAE